MSSKYISEFSRKKYNELARGMKGVDTLQFCAEERLFFEQLPIGEKKPLFHWESAVLHSEALKEMQVQVSAFTHNGHSPREENSLESGSGSGSDDSLESADDSSSCDSLDVDAQKRVIPNCETMRPRDEYPPSFEEEMRNFFGDLQMVANGVYGSIFYAENRCILKYPTHRNRDRFLSIIHEAFVGLNFTNKLREMGMLNYSYIYGFGKSSLPVVGMHPDVLDYTRRAELHQREVLSFVPPITDRKVPFCVYEHIPGHQIAHVVKKISLQCFKTLILNLSLLIEVGEKLGNFTHYDLHTRNLIARPIDKDVCAYFPKDWSFTTFRKSTFSEFIPTLIDYGTSHFSIGKNFSSSLLSPEGEGEEGEERSYSFPDEDLQYCGILHECNALTDIYKFLCYVAFTSQTYNLEVFNFIRRVFVYFNPEEDLLFALEAQKEKSFFYPPPEDSSKNITNFIAFYSSLIGVEVEEVTFSSKEEYLSVISEREKLFPNLRILDKFDDEMISTDYIDSPLKYNAEKYTPHFLFTSHRNTAILVYSLFLRVREWSLLSSVEREKRRDQIEKVKECVLSLSSKIYSRQIKEEETHLYDKALANAKDYYWYHLDLLSLVKLFK